MRTLALLASLLVAAAGAANDTDWDATIPVAEIREDFAALYAGLQSGHANLYANRSRAAYDARYRAMLASFDAPMRRFDVQLAFARFAAYGNVAHSRVAFPDDAFAAFREAGGRTFPIYPRIVDGVAYVGENYSGNPDIAVGDEIVTINGTPMSIWLERAAMHVSADTPYIAHSLMEFTFPRDLWAVAGEIERFELQLRRDGETRRVTLSATTRDTQRAAAADQPERFAIDSNARSHRMLDGRIAYLQPGPFYSVETPGNPWDNAAFVAFIDGAFESFIEAGAEALIIDLRQNPGGDNSFSDAMLAWIADEPFRFCSAFLIRSSDEAAASNAARLAQQAGATEGVSMRFAQRYATVPRGEMFEFEIPYALPRDGDRFDGAVYLLINRHSYSNAVNVAAMVKDYGFGIVAGEKTADMATTYGAMEQFTLPNTGIAVGFPKAHIIRPSGDPQPDGVSPDWPIPSPIVAGEDDSVLNALVDRIRSAASAPPPVHGAAASEPDN